MENNSKPQINKLLIRIKSTNIRSNFRGSNAKRQNEVRLKSLSLKKQRLNGSDHNRQLNLKRMKQKESIEQRLSPSLSETFYKKRQQNQPQFNLPRKGSRLQNIKNHSTLTSGFAKNPLNSLTNGKKEKKLTLKTQLIPSKVNAINMMFKTLHVYGLEAVKKLEYHQSVTANQNTSQNRSRNSSQNSNYINNSNDNYLSQQQQQLRQDHQQQLQQQQQKDIAFLNAKLVNEIFRYLKQRTQEESQPIREFTEIIFKLVCYYFVSFINENCHEMEFDHLGMVEFVERELGQSYCLDGRKGRRKGRRKRQEQGGESEVGRSKRWQEISSQNKWGESWNNEQQEPQYQSSNNLTIFNNNSHQEVVNEEQQNQQQQPQFKRKGYRVSSFFKSIDQSQGQSVTVNGNAFQPLENTSVRIGVLNNRKSKKVLNDERVAEGESENRIGEVKSLRWDVKELSKEKINHAFGERQTAIKKSPAINNATNKSKTSKGTTSFISSFPLIIASSNHLIVRPPSLLSKPKNSSNLNKKQPQKQNQPQKIIPQLNNNMNKLIQKIEQLQKIESQLERSIYQRDKYLKALENNLRQLSREKLEIQKREKQASEFANSQQCSEMIRNMISKKESITKNLTLLIQTNVWNSSNYSQSSQIQHMISTKQSSLQKMNSITRRFRACKQIIEMEPIIGQMRGAFFMTIDKYTQIVQDLQQRLGQAQESRAIILKSLEDWQIERKVREKIFNGVVIDYYGVERRVRAEVKRIPEEINTLQQLVLSLAQRYQSVIDTDNSNNTDSNYNNITPTSSNQNVPTNDQNILNPTTTNNGINIKQQFRSVLSGKSIALQKQICAYLQKMLVQNQKLFQQLQNQKRFSMILEKII